MVCPHCNMICDEKDRVCQRCGQMLPIPAKKGRHLVPVLAMVLLSALGIWMFFCYPGIPAPIQNDEIPWFTVSDGVLSFDPALYDGNCELEIPATIGSGTVTALADGCFEGCTELTAVYLPDTLLAIGEDAFRGCTALRGIRIPESVRFVGQRAFASCTALEAVYISAQTEAIGVHAFTDCRKLQYIYFLGNYRDWEALYPGFITADTVIFCDDGSFFQGGAAYDAP